MAPLSTGFGPTDGFHHHPLPVEGDICPLCGQRILNGDVAKVWARYHEYELKAKAEAEAGVQEKLAQVVHEIAEAKGRRESQGVAG